MLMTHPSFSQRIAGTGVSHGGYVGSGVGEGSTTSQKHILLSPGVTVVRSHVIGAARAVAVACPAWSVASGGVNVAVGMGVRVTSIMSRMTGVDVGANGSGVGLGDRMGEGVAYESDFAGVVVGETGNWAGVIPPITKPMPTSNNVPIEVSRALGMDDFVLWFGHFTGPPHFVQNVSSCDTSGLTC